MDHWQQHARRWQLVAAPLRPSAEDVAFVAPLLAERADVLLLGVTRELVAVPRAPGSTLVAVDRAAAMIESLFVPTAAARALVGEWTALSLAASSIDVALGDGVATVLASLEDYPALVAELARVVRPGGHVALRLFAAPAVPESLATIRVALPSITSFHTLKWRIAMAILDADRSVAVQAIRAAFDELVPDRAALPFPRDVIDHIDVYRDSPARYTFPSLAEVRALFTPFTEVACHLPSYELGDRCPTVIWRR